MIIGKTIKKMLEYGNNITILFTDNTIYKIDAGMEWDQPYIEGIYHKNFDGIDLYTQEELGLITEEERIKIEKEEEKIWKEKKAKQKKEEELKEYKRLQKKYGDFK